MPNLVVSITTIEENHGIILPLLTTRQSYIFQLCSELSLNYGVNVRGPATD